MTLTTDRMREIQDRWRRARPGRHLLTRQHVNDVTALMLQADVEAGTRAVFAALLAEVAQSPECKFAARAAALLQLHGHADY